MLIISEGFDSYRVLTPGTALPMNVLVVATSLTMNPPLGPLLMSCPDSYRYDASDRYYAIADMDDVERVIYLRKSKRCPGPDGSLQEEHRFNRQRLAQAQKHQQKQTRYAQDRTRMMRIPRHY